MNTRKRTSRINPALIATHVTDAAQHLRVEPCPPNQVDWFETTMQARHCLGSAHPVGDYLRQIVRNCLGEPVALLAWGPASYALKDRDLHISWDAHKRRTRLKLIVQNRRFALLTGKGAAPNLASQVLAASLRCLCEQWEQAHGYRPLMAESFTDPQKHEGTCYKASNWQPVGTTAGYSRHRADYYIPNDDPKCLWLYPLRPDAKKLLCAPTLPEPYARGLSPAPTGALPLNARQMDSLHELFARAKDPRGKNTTFRIRPVLTIVAMALLAGRRDIAEITRFGNILSQPQRQAIGLPRQKNTRFWRVPSYNVYYQLLRRMDNEAFASLLNEWMSQHAGTLPGALAMDGKMIRDQIGILTLASHEDGAPHYSAIYDKKEGTKRCEMKAAQAQLKALPQLDGKIITADALHCQKQTAELITAKGGDYVLQIKDNQRTLHKHAQAKGARPPFL